MDNLVKTYLDSKVGIWKECSIKSAASRLEHYTDVGPQLVYTQLQAKGYKPYYIKIVFITISSFMDWLIAQGRATSNPYKAFIKQNNQLFRNAYEDKYATITWEEYLEEYRKADPKMQTALALLGYGGCRISELHSFDGSTVVGKGGKRRKVFVPAGMANVVCDLSVHQIRRKLAHNPHSYRKLAADKWLRSGIDVKTVQTLLGHTSLTSTQRYLRPLEQDALKEKLQDIWEKQA